MYKMRKDEMKDYKKKGDIKGELVLDGNLMSLTGDLTVETYINVSGYINCAGLKTIGSWWLD